MRDDAERLRDILDAVERIERYTGGRTDAFEKNELIQNWVVSHIQVIGEACARLSQQLREAHPETPWSKIVGMRNILGHSYFDIDVETTKGVLVRDFPNLKAQAGSILHQIESSREFGA